MTVTTQKLTPVPMPIFIGYASLEEWIEQVDPQRPVLCLRLAEPGSGNGTGMQTEELTVHCQQVATDFSVHYVRLRAGSITLCYGEPFDTDWQEREMAWESLWQCVKALLEEATLTVHPASIARPKNLVLLEARSERIAFDRGSKRYVLKEAKHG